MLSYFGAEAQEKIRVWRSLVSRLNGVQEASSSNLDTRTKKAETTFVVSAIFFCVEIRKNKCRCPVDICLIPARRDRHYNVTNLDTRTHKKERNPKAEKNIRAKRAFAFSAFLFCVEIRKNKCRCPVDICLIPARRDQHHSVTAPNTRTPLVLA